MTSGQRIANPCAACKTRVKLRFSFSPAGGIRVVCDGCDSHGARTYEDHDTAIGLWNEQQQKGLDHD